MIPQPPPAILCEAKESWPIDRVRFLVAIKLVEGDAANPYGLSDDTRKQSSRDVKDKTEFNLAMANLVWLINTIPLIGMKPDVFTLALCWKRGRSGAQHVLEYEQNYEPGKCAVDLDYAARVNNTYYSLHFKML